jgi:hypothetical protein
MTGRRRRLYREGRPGDNGRFALHSTPRAGPCRCALYGWPALWPCRKGVAVGRQAALLQRDVGRLDMEHPLARPGRGRRVVLRARDQQDAARRIRGGERRWARWPRFELVHACFSRETRSCGKRYQAEARSVWEERVGAAQTGGRTGLTRAERDIVRAAEFFAKHEARRSAGSGEEGRLQRPEAGDERRPSLAGAGGREWRSGRPPPCVD